MTWIWWSEFWFHQSVLPPSDPLHLQTKSRAYLIGQTWETSLPVDITANQDHYITTDKHNHIKWTSELVGDITSSRHHSQLRTLHPMQQKTNITSDKDLQWWETSLLADIQKQYSRSTTDKYHHSSQTTLLPDIIAYYITLVSQSWHHQQTTLPLNDITPRRHQSWHL